jgi:hypothetical protein
MIDIHVKPQAGTGVDIYVADGGNHEQLLHSSQGYENHGDAEALVERLFGADANARKLAMIGELLTAPGVDLEAIAAIINDQDDQPEPVQLTVHWRNGTTANRQIR